MTHDPSGRLPVTILSGFPSVANSPSTPERLWPSVTERLDSGAHGHILRSKSLFTPASRPGGDRGGAPSAPELVLIGTLWTPMRSGRPDRLSHDGRRGPPAGPFPAPDTYGIDETRDREP
ncbi:hypothetical protein ACIRU3_08005 [Streptomyces sp. NPDC101151]|uniref:hypothetical protein n=1 Tax=Streptomyces sp. NPDC101151 TaxID=3366115 RepID=UPI00380174FA